MNANCCQTELDVTNPILMCYILCMNGVEYICINFPKFKATFNKIYFISWPLILLEDEVGVLRQNHQPRAGD